MTRAKGDMGSSREGVTGRERPGDKGTLAHGEKGNETSSLGNRWTILLGDQETRADAEKRRKGLEDVKGTRGQEDRGKWEKGDKGL